jgi:DNA-directed RNA polymerase specialized sigma24 family protein
MSRIAFDPRVIDAVGYCRTDGTKCFRTRTDSLKYKEFDEPSPPQRSTPWELALAAILAHASFPLLRANVLDGLSLEEIAKREGVNKSTISRRIQELRKQLQGQWRGTLFPVSNRSNDQCQVDDVESTSDK